MAEPAIRVAVFNPVVAYRQALVRALDLRPDIEAAGCGGDVTDILAAIRDTDPDVIVVDVAQPEGADVARLISGDEASPKVIALGVVNRAEVLTCVEMGVSGVVLREQPLEDLLSAVHAAMRGEVLIDPRVAAMLARRVASLAGRHGSESEGSVLTPRETEIVELIDQGLSNKEIAKRLDISICTVKNHVHNVLEKLGVSRRGQAAALLRKRRQLGPIVAPARIGPLAG